MSRALSLLFPLLTAALAARTLQAQGIAAEAACSDWSDPHVKTVEVGPTDDFVQAVRGAASGTTVLFKPGTYHVGATLQLAVPDVTLRSTTGKRDDVILDGNLVDAAPTPANFLNETVAVSASGVVIA